MSLNAPSIDMERLCHAATLASTQAPRHAGEVLSRAHRRSRSSLPFFAGTFVFGWLLGLAVVAKLLHMAHAPLSMMIGGVGYVSFMLGPVIVAFAVARLGLSLVARGWGGVPLRLLGAGAVTLVAGFLVL